jgi:hypothetical protein
MCPDKVHNYQNIIHTRNTVDKYTDNVANNLRIQLCNISQHFKAFSIANDESKDVNGVTQLAGFI